jgi:hypothetical protein
MGIADNEVPDEYLCELCLPRKIDVPRAQAKQRQRQSLIARVEKKRAAKLSSRDVKINPDQSPTSTAVATSPKKSRKASKKQPKPSLALTRTFVNVPASRLNIDAPPLSESTKEDRDISVDQASSVLGSSVPDLERLSSASPNLGFTTAEKGKARALLDGDPSAVADQPPAKGRKPRAPVTKKISALKPTVGALSNTPEWFAGRSKVIEGGGLGFEPVELDIESARRGMRVRPRLKARPPVWAYSRQEMCEVSPVATHAAYIDV